MKLNHTRGPWVVSYLLNGHTYIRDRKGAEIARMGSENMLADDSSAADNAELIAAAPRMYSMLNRLAGAIERQRTTGSLDGLGEDVRRLLAELEPS